MIHVLLYGKNISEISGSKYSILSSEGKITHQKANLMNGNGKFREAKRISGFHEKR
ncbi:hypothetical protein [Nitrosopumilus ureiphilus]|uniref:hypothetical protein n=1 Tax=Nitrosopumilus ureiphilus TaxID=1470067 RepID=UPI0015CB29E1|nr:hypothetical protein [Nitrosopumilus ureiphilus]